MKLAQQLQAISQNGLTFAEDHFDRARYEEVRAIAAQLMALGSDGEYEKILALFAQEVGYTTPKVDVRAVVMDGDKMLFVRERSDDKWSLPGGWADPCYTARESIEKEIREESGFEVKTEKLLAVYDRSRHGHPPYPYHVYKHFFLCSITGGTPAVSEETSAVEFFEEERLPELSPGRVTAKQISRMFEHTRHPEWPTDFD